ncbi:MAG TPA: HtaA domain-containing protein, partial [Candidatus Agrococcus pullicola]|nr:HtaA domain-containing protein [Candidatus Agrococcus pullicola]
FSGHSGILHVEISNPRVVVNADGSGSIFADVESKEFIDTVTEGEIIEYPNVELVTFDSGEWGGNAGGAGSGSASLQSVTPLATQATTDESFVSDITELTADGAPAFGGFYSAGEEFDGFTLNSAEQDVTNPDNNNGNNNNNAGNNNESSNNAGGNVNGGDQENCVAYEVSGSLDWGLKESFRNYIEGGIAKGAINTSGIEHSDDGFRWSGSGQLNTDAMLGEVSMPGTLHFTGHDGVLDTKISNVRLVIHSSSQASIYADVVSNDMEGNAHDLTGVRFANVNVSGASLTSDSFSVSGAATTLTDDGAKAFAGFYEAGIELDPVSFSLTLGNEVPCNDAVNPSGEGLAQTGFESPALALIAFALALAALGARGVAVAQRRRS